MSKRLIIPLAMLGILGTSGAVFAATQPPGDVHHRYVRHMNHISAQHQAELQYHRQPWNLPEGWPHS